MGTDCRLVAMGTPAGDEQGSACPTGRLEGRRRRPRPARALRRPVGRAPAQRSRSRTTAPCACAQGRSLPLPFETHLGREPWKTTARGGPSPGRRGHRARVGGPVGLRERRDRCRPVRACGSSIARAASRLSLTGVRCRPRRRRPGSHGTAPPRRAALRLRRTQRRPRQARREAALPQSRRAPPCRGLPLPVDPVRARCGAGRRRGLRRAACCSTRSGQSRSTPLRPGRTRSSSRPGATESDVAFFPGPDAGGRGAVALPRVSAGRRCRRSGRWATTSRAGPTEAQAQVRKIAGELRRRRIPTDAIHLDIDYMDGYRVFTWNTEALPGPEGPARELDAQGLRTVTIVDPGVKRDSRASPCTAKGSQRGYFCRTGDGEEYGLRVWPGDAALPDFNREDVRAWWGELHDRCCEAGVAGIWNDMNEPAGWRSDLRAGKAPPDLRGQDTGELVQADPREPDREVPHETRAQHLRSAAVPSDPRDPGESAVPGVRPFVLTRSGVRPGIQRHAAVWTGDNASTLVSPARVDPDAAEPLGLGRSLLRRRHRRLQRLVHAGALRPLDPARRALPLLPHPLDGDLPAPGALELRPARGGHRSPSARAAHAAHAVPLRSLPRGRGHRAPPVWRPLYWDFPDAA